MRNNTIIAFLNPYCEVTMSTHFYNGFQRNCKNGTMEKRLENEGNIVRAKTGCLSGVSNLSVYIFSPKHGPLAFSILISGYTGSSYQAIQLQNKIVQTFLHD